MENFREEEPLEPALMTQDATKALSHFSDELGSDRLSKGLHQNFVSSTSILTYDTVDIQEERADNSRKSRVYLVIFVIVNVFLNLWFLHAYLNIRELDLDPNFQ